MQDTLVLGRLVWVAGFALIVVGVVCLYLSGAVVTGWWQGTLDAFGVGFIVGGLIDVLALSGLNRAIAGEQKRLENERRMNNQLAEALLRPVRDAPTEKDDTLERAVKAFRLMQVPQDQLDPGLRAELVRFVFNVGPEEWQMLAELPGWIAPNSPCPCGSGRMYKRCHGDPRPRPDC